MRTTAYAPLATLLLLGAMSVGCSKKPSDDTIRSQLVGVWSFRPREQLPPEKIEDDTGIYATPVEKVFQFTPTVPKDHDRGTYVEYRNIPKNKNLDSARWVIWERGNWYVLGDAVSLQPERGSDIDYKVLFVGPRTLRVSGEPGFACKNGCVLDPRTELPAEARSAKPR
jgi:hypothetical protein